MNVFDFRNRFYEVVEKIYDNNFQIASEVVRMGYPEICNEIPTAGVSWDDKKKKVKFLFNSDFYDVLSDDELMFVIAHESMHFIHLHAQLFSKEFNSLKRKNLDSQIPRFMKSLNIAADCVVNDSLVEIYGFDDELKENRFVKYGQKNIQIPKACRGEEFVGFKVHNFTVMQVVDLLKQDKVDSMLGKGDEFDSHNWNAQNFFDSNGELREEVKQALKEAIENLDGNSSVGDKERKIILDIKNNMKGVGVESSSSRRTIDLRGESLKWEKLLANEITMKKFEDDWAKCPRSLFAIYPDVILPTEKPTEEQDIFVAVDSSGSIDRTALSLFASVLKNVPKHVRIKSISFDTKAHEFDVKKDQNPAGGGGTNFQVIEDYILNNLKKYPKLVLVLTDGEAPPIHPKHPNRWLWLIYGNRSYGCGNMKNFDIYKLLR